MVATNGTNPTFARRVTSSIVTGLMMFSLMIGAGAAATQANAAPPPTSAVNGTTQTTGPTFPTTGGTAEKPNNGKKPKKQTAQPPVTCVHFTQDEAIIVFGEDPGPGGFTNCFFTSDLKQ